MPFPPFLRSDSQSDNASQGNLDPNSARPQLKLVSKCKVGEFTAHQYIIAAVLIPEDDGFISISSDRSVRLWLKRESGRYWPSICEYLPMNPTSLLYSQEAKTVFIGLDDGNVMGFTLADDLNKITPTLKYGGHIASITSLTLNVRRKFLFTTGEDKRLTWNNSDNGQLVGSVELKSVTNCSCIDDITGCVFVGEDSGTIQFFNISDYSANVPMKSSELSRHKAGVTRVEWDCKQGRLFSCGADQKIIVWNISHQRGIYYELVGQLSEPIGASMDPLLGLISCYQNGCVILWDVDKQYWEVAPVWQESDSCQRCNEHFFWDFRQMWTRKRIGVRQHHCRRCGRAICHNCSRSLTMLPAFGFEIPIRVCVDCNLATTPSEKTSLSRFGNIQGTITYMDYDHATKRLLTVCKDKTISVVEVQVEN